MRAMDLTDEPTRIANMTRLTNISTKTIERPPSEKNATLLAKYMKHTRHEREIYYTRSPRDKTLITERSVAFQGVHSETDSFAHTRSALARLLPSSGAADGSTTPLGRLATTYWDFSRGILAR